MKNFTAQFFRITCTLLLIVVSASAQNPIIGDQFSADPTARVFEGRIYVYPSHDIFCGTSWFCMKDYHVFSSENLTDWTDHGMIVTQEKVDWVDSTKYSMWAPDCMERDGKYYFYFPAIADTNKGLRGMGIGVAIGNKPYGPFTPEPLPIKGVGGIDPNVFIDHDGQAYLYWAGFGGLQGAKLKENMLELASEPQVIESLPKGMKEGPFLFERNGIYYFTFPHVIDTTEALVYAMGNNPLGPFEYKGVIVDEYRSCWTIHHSMLEYQGQWYLFYHRNDLSPHFDKNRSVRADSLFFNEDGTIKKVTPTFRGIGITRADSKIQIDRYSKKSAAGSSVAFLDTADTFGGWKTVLDGKGAWIQYNTVDFEDGSLKQVDVQGLSETGGAIEIRMDGVDGPVLAKIKIGKTPDWSLMSGKLSTVPSGRHNLYVLSTKAGQIEIDWIRFK